MSSDSCRFCFLCLRWGLAPADQTDSCPEGDSGGSETTFSPGPRVGHWSPSTQTHSFQRAHDGDTSFKRSLTALIMAVERSHAQGRGVENSYVVTNQRGHLHQPRWRNSCRLQYVQARLAQTVMAAQFSCNQSNNDGVTLAFKVVSHLRDEDTSTDDVWVTLIESQTSAWRFPAHRSVSQRCFIPMTTASACSHVSGLPVTDVPGNDVTAYIPKRAQALRARRRGFILENQNRCFEFAIRWNYGISVNPQIVPPSFKVT